MLNYFGNSGTESAEFPTFSGFAERMGVSLGRLKEQKEKDPTFAKVWEECLERQKARLVVGGLTRTYDPSFCKFLLGTLASETADSAFCVKIEVVE